MGPTDIVTVSSGCHLSVRLRLKMESDVEKEALPKRPLYSKLKFISVPGKEKPAEITRAGLSNTHLESEISFEFAYCL